MAEAMELVLERSRAPSSCENAREPMVALPAPPGAAPATEPDEAGVAPRRTRLRALWSQFAGDWTECMGVLAAGGRYGASPFGWPPF